MAELRMLFLSTWPASIPTAPQRNQGSGAQGQLMYAVRISGREAAVLRTRPVSV